MPSCLSRDHEASRPSELARVVNFHHFTSEEEFRTCVHLTNKFERCRQPINKDDRPKARQLYLKIQSSLADGTLVSGSLLSLAEITLCNHVHRPNFRTKALFPSIVEKWNNDLEAKKVAPGASVVEQTVTEVAMNETSSLLKKKVATSIREDHPQCPKTTNDQIPGIPDILVEEEPESKDEKRTCSTTVSKPTVLIEEKEVCEEITELPVCELRNLDSKIEAVPIPPAQSLIKRMTRSGTFSSGSSKEYLPYCPQLLTLTSPQLIQHTNQSLFSILARPLSTMAKKVGCVYIFTRPGDLSHVKIGYTKHSGEARVNAWAKQCCYAARLEYETEMIAHAWLVERLVQEQLKLYRRTEQKCKWKPLCPKKHSEWYEISVGDATKAVKRWADWITKYGPWGSDQALSPDWMSLLNQYRIALEGTERDPDMWDRWVKMENPRTTDIPVTPKLTPRQNPKRQEPVQETPNPRSRREPCPSTLNSKTSQSHTPAKTPNTTLNSIQSDDPFLCLSPAPTTSFSLTTPLRRSPRHTPQATPDAVREILQSALSSLDTYMNSSSSPCSSRFSSHSSPFSSPSSSPFSRKNKDRKRNPTVTIRMNSKSVSLSWGEVDEGYCTA